MFVAPWDFRGLPRGRTMGNVFFFLLAPVGDGGGCCRSIRSPSHSPSERMGGVAGEGAVPMPVSIPPLSYHTCTAQHTRAPFKHSYVVCAVAICTYVYACMYVCILLHFRDKTIKQTIEIEYVGQGNRRRILQNI